LGSARFQRAAFGIVPGASASADLCFGKMPEHYRLEAGDPASIRFRLRGIK
jgi:hypothetical protein